MALNEALDDLKAWCNGSWKKPNATHCVHVTYTKNVDVENNPEAEPQERYQGLLFYSADLDRLVGLIRATYVPGQIFPSRPWILMFLPLDGSEVHINKYADVDNLPGPPLRQEKVLPTDGSVSNAMQGEINLDDPWWVLYKKTTADAVSLTFKGLPPV
jgi:hypothetical protein